MSKSFITLSVDEGKTWGHVDWSIPGLYGAAKDDPLGFSDKIDWNYNPEHPHVLKYFSPSFTLTLHFKNREAWEDFKKKIVEMNPVEGEFSDQMVTL